jgi:hypothetical protein
MPCYPKWSLHDSRQELCVYFSCRMRVTCPPLMQSVSSDKRVIFLSSILISSSTICLVIPSGLFMISDKNFVCIYFSCRMRVTCPPPPLQTQLSPWNIHFKWSLATLNKMNRHHMIFGQVSDLCRTFECSLPFDFKFWRMLHRSRVLWRTQRSESENGWITCHFRLQSRFLMSGC